MAVVFEVPRKCQPRWVECVPREVWAGHELSQHRDAKFTPPTVGVNGEGRKAGASCQEPCCLKSRRDWRASGGAGAAGKGGSDPKGVNRLGKGTEMPFVKAGR